MKMLRLLILMGCLSPAFALAPILLPQPSSNP